MGYLTFFCLNFIFVIFGLKFIEPIFGLNVFTALAAFLCVWVIPIWRWNNCLWSASVSGMKTTLLEDIHRDWTKTVGFQGGNQLSRVLSSGDRLKIIAGTRRVLDIKKELLSRYNKVNDLNNGQLISEIKSLEDELLKG